MRKRYTLEQVRDYFKEQGCELLEEEYKNARIPMAYRCVCGNISKMKYSHFKDGHRCKKCSGTEKLTLNYVRTYFKKNGCTLIEKKYKNSHSLMKYICVCGNTSKTSFANFQSGKRCLKCKSKKLSEKLRYPFEYVKNYFKEQGCELLEEKYDGATVPLRYKCKCGNISTIGFSSFLQGHRCMECGGKKRLSFEYVQNYFKDHDCELLEKEYKNNSVLMRYKCSCGRISKINFGNFKFGRRCSACGGTKRLTFKYIQKHFKDHNCELLEKEYKNNRTLLKYKCSCGNISKICFASFQSGTRCSKCSGVEKHSFEYVYNYFKDHNCELLEKEYKNNQTYMKYKCSCGHISKIFFGSFQSGVRCKKCGYKKLVRRGPDNLLYNHNLTDEERKVKRQYAEYNDWRNSIYKQDNYICVKCFQKGHYLNAHHIKNYSTNKDLRLDINNGKTLCKNCHKEFHKKYGTKNNNQEQLDEFLGIKNLMTLP